MLLLSSKQLGIFEDISPFVLCLETALMGHKHADTLALILQGGRNVLMR